ncbi:hypothetical protein [Marinicrinis sediminis]|uniref:Tetratricopeptide repeat protein n=1 Tax=Marinicrinis sediminis TaxID=1652465 RepID=A0ABW5RDQ7_9BACL
MFKQLFAAMNEVLEDVNSQYATADLTQKKEMEEKLALLRAMSDTCIEQWLQFEEKMAEMQAASLGSPLDFSQYASQDAAAHFEKGQGYFQLLMYPAAIEQFQASCQLEPEFLPAKLFLGLSYLHIGEWEEAARHLKWVNSVSEHPLLRAITFNAMGCIYVQRNQPEEASALFEKAAALEPSMAQPMTELNAPHATNDLLIQTGLIQ